VMRSMFAVTALFVVAVSLYGGCGEDESSEATAEGTGLQPSPTGATRPEVEDSETSCAGTWMWVMGTMELEPDGPGQMDFGLLGGTKHDTVGVTWRSEGDHVVISQNGQEMAAYATADGKCLSVQGEPIAGTWVRLDEQTTQRLAAVRVFLEEKGHPGPAFGPAAERDFADRAEESALQASCLRNMKRLSLALLSYAQDNDGRYPPPGIDWEDAVAPYVGNKRELFCCPSDDGHSSYQLNPKLAGRRLAGVTHTIVAELVVLFESDDGKSVAHRHNGGANYCYADCHVNWLTQTRAESVLWDLAGSH